MYKEYIELYKTYTQKYGQKTAIFLMVGSFYELYDIQDIETGETVCNVREVAEYLGIQLSTKKGDFSPNQDGIFAGFPDYAMHKWAGRLTSVGWTVVIVDQIKDLRGKVKERKVSRILSPSTHIENISSTDTPYVITLYMEQQSQQAPFFGVGILDLTTGTTHTYSGVANGRPDIWTADDLIQLISVFQPKELLIYYKSQSTPDESLFRRILGLPSTITIHMRQVENAGAFSKELVRTEYLQKIYSIKSILPPLTYLGIRSTYEEFALLYLLQFVEEHYPSMLHTFHRNEPWIPQMRLICGNHALTQLQMTSSTGNNNESVVGLFDKCITSMGKRAIRERLLRPYSDANEISARLREVHDYTMWTDEKIRMLTRQLRFMYDLPRLHRKMLCGLISAQEIAGLFQTYNAIQMIMTHVTANTILQEPFTQEDWTAYMNVFRRHFSEEKASLANNDRTAFNVETYKDIGKKEMDIIQLLEKFQQLRSEIAKSGGVHEDAIRLEEREKEPYGLKGSTITLQQLKKNIKNLPEGMKISELKSGGWIDCTQLQILNTQLQKAREALMHLVRSYLVDACLAISEAGQKLWTVMEQWVCHIDCTQCIGQVSKERGFTCPVITESEESYVDITNIRHPLVEASSTRISYVKHNVKLGNNSSNGWLVYGMNASGKSTLMKATGICILLAQAGCFVPAKHMTLSPFQAVYTRILNQDNLFAGLSSFAVEMSELRDILRNATSHSLVLGDELCAGTESISALALVASGIQWLSSRNAKFIFATHLHDLSEIIKDTKIAVDVWHLHVEYDPITKKLIYDRSLRPGNGSTLYGLEVARAMDLPFEFIELALKNRNRITGNVVQEDATGSAWNKNIVRKECELCKKPAGLEVHHIVPRASASNAILEDGTSMNDKRNLMVICQACHDDIHAGKMEIGEMKVTSDGPQREIYMKEKASTKKSKWTAKEHEIIINALHTYSLLSMKAIKGHLYSTHSIEISESVLRRYKNDK